MKNKASKMVKTKINVGFGVDIEINTLKETVTVTNKLANVTFTEKGVQYNPHNNCAQCGKKFGTNKECSWCMNFKILEYFREHKSYIIKYFRENHEPSELPENDNDLEDWYQTELREVAKDFMEQEK